MSTLKNIEKKEQLDKIFSDQKKATRFIKNNKFFVHEIFRKHFHRSCFLIEDKEDIIQSGLLGMCTAFSNFKEDNNFVGYTYGLILNHMRNYRKMIAKEYKCGDSIDGISESMVDESFEEKIVMEMTTTWVYTLLDDLEKKIFKMKSRGYTFNEIANKLQMKNHKVKFVYYRKIVPKLKKHKSAIDMASEYVYES